jgi:hypothetical protein
MQYKGITIGNSCQFVLLNGLTIGFVSDIAEEAVLAHAKLISTRSLRHIPTKPCHTFKVFNRVRPARMLSLAMQIDVNQSLTLRYEYGGRRGSGLYIGCDPTNR